MSNVARQVVNDRHARPSAGRKVWKGWLMKPKRHAGARADGNGEWKVHRKAKSAPPPPKAAKKKEQR